MAKSKPRVLTQCVANTYAMPNERIIEFMSVSRKGGLISIRQMEDGSVVVEPYRLDAGVVVRFNGKDCEG
jgi:hypothetical protein